MKSYSGAPTRAKRAWDRTQYSWNMVNLFSFGCHVIDCKYASTDCKGGIGGDLKPLAPRIVIVTETSVDEGDWGEDGVVRAKI